MSNYSQFFLFGGGGTVLTPGVVTPSPANPYTGIFGTGIVRLYTKNDTFVVPSQINTVRVRVWGAGGFNGGGGGGFALKVVSGLSEGDSISVTVGLGGVNTVTPNGGSSSFGSHVSATGGLGAPGDRFGGTGSGGDINNTGGTNQGGAAGLFGDGGSTAAGVSPNGCAGSAGGQGFTGSPPGSLGAPTPGLTYAIDFIATGGGGSSTGALNGANGGGGSGGGSGGIPGGGGGNNSGLGARGLVVVEY